jgi:hypothetical protein
MECGHLLLFKYRAGGFFRGDDFYQEKKGIRHL